jgi:hypothetical protein
MRYFVFDTGTPHEEYSTLIIVNSKEEADQYLADHKRDGTVIYILSENDLWGALFDAIEYDHAAWNQNTHGF